MSPASGSLSRSCGTPGESPIFMPKTRTTCSSLRDTMSPPTASSRWKSGGARRPGRWPRFSGKRSLIATSGHGCSNSAAISRPRWISIILGAKRSWPRLWPASMLMSTGFSGIRRSCPWNSGCWESGPGIGRPKSSSPARTGSSAMSAMKSPWLARFGSGREKSSGSSSISIPEIPSCAWPMACAPIC